MLHKSASGPEIGFRGGFRLDSSRENIKIGSPAGRRPVGGSILKLSRRPKSGPEAGFPARKHYCVTQGADRTLPPEYTTGGHTTTLLLLPYLIVLVGRLCFKHNGEGYKLMPLRPKL